MTDQASVSHKRPTLIIEAGRFASNYWGDLWRYRELFVFLTWRDLLLRYKQTAVGVVWALIQPALTTVIFCAFGAFLKLPTNGLPRVVLIYAGQLPWSFFASSLSASSGSLVGNAHLISKVYFPRLIVPASAVAVSLVDFFISAVFLGILMAIFGVVPDAHLLILPLFILLAFLAALGAGLWLTAANVKYRDFKFIVPFVAQFGLYASPVAFTSSVVPERWRTLYSLNPMVGVIDGFRWCIFSGRTPIDWNSVAISSVVVVIVLVTGIRYFRSTERTFADVI